MSVVFIPLEVINRELDSKILLATNLAANSSFVVLGHKGPVFFYAKNSKFPGIFFYKSIQKKYFEKMRQMGHAVVAQDEEGGFTWKNYESWTRTERPSLLEANYADKFFTWGDEEFRFLTENEIIESDKLVNSGGMRTSLWGTKGTEFYSQEIIKIKEKCGNYILLALTVPIADYYFSKHDEAPSISRPNYKVDEYQTQLIVSLIDSLLSDFNLNIVIRPHPSDNGARWKKLAQTNRRIHVSLERLSTPWIHASECVIHYGSTIGIESVVAKKPTFDIRNGFFFKAPYQLLASWQDRLSIQITDYDDLKSKLQNLEELNFDQSNIEYLKSRLKNIDNLEAIKLITKELLNLQNSKKLEISVKPKLNIKLYLFTHLFYWTLFFSNRRLYIHNKFKRPKINKKYVISKVEASREILNIEDNIKVKTLAGSCYLIYKSN